jgi:hypothetical protein
MHPFLHTRGNQPATTDLHCNGSSKIILCCVAFLLFTSQTRVNATESLSACTLPPDQAAVVDAARAIARREISISEVDLFDKIIWRLNSQSQQVTAAAYLENSKPVIELSGLIFEVMCALTRDMGALEIAVGSTKLAAMMAKTGWDQCLVNEISLSHCPFLKSSAASNIPDEKERSRALEILSNAKQQSRFRRELTSVYAFVILHEFGHIALRHAELASVSPEVHRRQERDADFFAISHLLRDPNATLIELDHAMYYYARIEAKEPSAGYDRISCRTYWATAFELQDQTFKHVVDRIMQSFSRGTPIDNSMASLLDLPPLSSSPPAECNTSTSINQAVSAYARDVQILSPYVKQIVKFYEAGQIDDLLRLIANPSATVQSIAGRAYKASLESAVVARIAFQYGPSARGGAAALASMEAQLPLVRLQTAAQILESIGAYGLLVDRSIPADKRIQKSEESLLRATGYDQSRSLAWGCLGLIFISKGFYDDAKKVILNSLATAEYQGFAIPLKILLGQLDVDPERARTAVNQRFGIEPSARGIR